ncbi:reverse transcriptase [Tanacetum coccineum]
MLFLRNEQESDSCLLSGDASLCNPFNLVIADEDFHEGFNVVYSKAISSSLRRIFKRHALLFEEMSDEYNIPAAANCKTIREFDEALTRVSFGFKSVNDYNLKSGNAESIKHVRKPLLCIQGANDSIALARGIPRQDTKACFSFIPQAKYVYELTECYSCNFLQELLVALCSGGIHLSGNKRTNKTQSFDQKFDKSNEALRVNCKKRYHVRVVRTTNSPLPHEHNSTWDQSVLDANLQETSMKIKKMLTRQTVFPAISTEVSHPDDLLFTHTKQNYRRFEGFQYGSDNSFSLQYPESVIPIVVTDTGWPWAGGANKRDAMVENAEKFNNNLIQLVMNDSGPPSGLFCTSSCLFRKKKPHTFSSASTPVEAENWISHIEKIFEVLGCDDQFKASIFHTQRKKGVNESTNRFVANAARNIEIFRDQPKNEGDNQRDIDGYRIRPSETPSQGQGSDKHGNGSDRQENGSQKAWGDQDQQVRGQHYSHSYGSSSKSGYPDYNSCPPCNLYGKFHPGKACHRATGACFECGEVGHLAKDCKKGSTSSGGKRFGMFPFKFRH